MDNFIQKLKNSTDALHKEAEQSGLSKAVMSPHVSKETYAEYLSKAFVLHSQIEEKLFPLVNSVIKDVEVRRKSVSLKEDLHDLSYSSISEDTFLDEDYNSDLSFNIGLFYVCEGSTLGGLYILKNIQKTMGAEITGKFLNIYGDKTGIYWKAFLAQLNEYQLNVSEEEREKIIEGAVYGFKRAKHVFEDSKIV